MMSGSVVLVTGCSKGGIGYEIGRVLASKGCQVYATARNLGLLDGLQHQGCVLLQLDVTDTAAVEKVVRRIIREAGRIDILINNAGTALRGWAVDTPLQKVRQLMEVNYFAVLALSQAVAPYMIERRSGLIVNIGSVTSYSVIPGASAYCASKFAVRAYSNALRMELAAFGVNVMHVAPGFIKTNLLRSSATVGLRPDSPFNQLKYATRVLRENNELEDGITGWGATDVSVFAARLAKAILSTTPPREYLDGWLWRAMYYLGCYAPLWFVDHLHRARMQLYSFLQEH